MAVGRDGERGVVGGDGRHFEEGSGVGGLFIIEDEAG